MGFTLLCLYQPLMSSKQHHYCMYARSRYISPATPFKYVSPIVIFPAGWFTCWSASHHLNIISNRLERQLQRVFALSLLILASSQPHREWLLH